MVVDFLVVFRGSSRGWNQGRCVLFGAYVYTCDFYGFFLVVCEAGTSPSSPNAPSPSHAPSPHNSPQIPTPVPLHLITQRTNPHIPYLQGHIRRSKSVYLALSLGTAARMHDLPHNLCLRDWSIKRPDIL